ncbi:vomeronasal type-2 receptor, partial [Pristimantis euphronides]
MPCYIHFSLDSMTSKYLLPRQISYGTMTPVFNVTHRLPSFYQAAANELSEIDAIVQMLKHFAWKWVGILVSDDDTGQIAGDTFKKEIASSGGCVAFFITLEEDAFESSESISTIFQTINNSSANVTVVFLSVKFADTFAHVFAKPKLRPIIWITSSYFIRILELQCLKRGTTFDGTLSLSAHQGDIPGFRDYFYSIKPINFPDDKLMGEVWKRLVLQNISSPTSSAVLKCIGNETLNEAYLSLLNVFEYRTSYIVYTTIYTMAHSLHDMFATSKSKNLQNCFQHWRCWDGGSLPLPLSFSIALLCPFLSLLPNFFSSHPSAYMNQKGRQTFKVPPSLCSEPCKPGYWKAKREGEPPCCYDCVQCAKGEMSNTTDSQSCMKCSSYENSNTDRTRCVPRDVSFLSYGDILGAALTSVSLLFSIMTSVILGVFWKHRETPIVRANNRNLSYVLLISIMLCFICPLLFIGRPSPIRCLLRQAAFGVVFTISVSSVLAKTLTVIIAFMATQPGSRMKKLLGIRLSFTLVFLCSMGEILLSVIWIMFYPPYLDVDTAMDTILLLCNEGSPTFFFLEIGYIGMLALICLVAAFLAKDFPDRYNEAKNISFSILIFCSVWVTFVPTYLSVKGKNMVAVEVFAILTSTAGLLTFIFLPKCYII